MTTTLAAHPAKDLLIADLQSTIAALTREIDVGFSPDARALILRLETTAKWLANSIAPGQPGYVTRTICYPEPLKVMYRGEMRSIGEKLTCEIKMDDSSSQAEIAPKCQTCGHWTGSPCKEGGIYLAGENGRTSPIPLAPAVKTEMLRAQKEARVLREALEASVKIIRNMGLGLTTLNAQERDPESALNQARAALKGTP